MRAVARTAIRCLVAVWMIGGVGGAAAQPTGVVTTTPAARSDNADAATQRLLLDGVRAFRAERYEEALQIFHRVKSQHLLQDIGFYEGMALHKLGRHAEALVAFRAAHGQGLREPVADYYQAVSCYRLGMMSRARRECSALLPTAHDNTAPLGPRLTLGVQQFLRALDSAPANTERLQTVLSSAESAVPRSGQEALEWLDEAAELMTSVGKIPTYRQRFRELVKHARAAADASSVAASELGARPAAAQTVHELNLLWCRVAGAADCTL